MPTTTFANLPPEKKEKLLGAIRDELMRVPFERVSINQIVQKAGIPRGSFYQYFAGKHDMLDYMLAEYQAHLCRLVRESLSASGGDVFRLFRDLFDSASQFVLGGEGRGFYRRLFSDVRINLGFCGRHAKENILSLFKNEIVPRLNLKALKVRDEEELRCLLEILAAGTRDALAEAFLDLDNHIQAKTRFETKINMLRREFGAAGEEQAHCSN